MRNAAANFDDDLGYDEPRRPAPRKPRPASGKPKSRKKKGKRFAFDLQKVARYAAVGMSATLALGIMVNALVMQKGHHPAPLFGKAITLTETKPVEKASAPARTTQEAMTAPAPELEQTASIAALAAAPLPVAKPRRAAAPVVAEKEPGDDAIGRMLRGEAEPRAVGDRIGPTTVLGAQKALAKLGFTLKPNGTMGPATRKAIEAFEKERNLPVKGELSHRIVKILSAESGVRID